MNKYAILVVCTDNLCRSPTAEVVLRQKAIQHGLADRVRVASRATHDFNVGDPIDFHAQKHAMRRGYDLCALEVRLLQAEDFERFDLILAMDENNMQTLRRRCPPKYHDKLDYFTAYCSAEVRRDVPDPFYGKPDDFEQVLNLVEDASDGLLEFVRTQAS